MEVSNLAYDVGRELGLSEEMCHELAVAGIVHDIGKIPLSGYVEGDDTLVVEEMRFVRMHAQLSYELLKDRGYSDFILQAILYHHENMDGSGYPDNLSGEEIPYGARILRICDVYSALTSDRPYRRAFDRDTAVELMIDEIKNFDMEIFIAFLRVVHDHPQRVIHLEGIEGIIEGELRQ
ncbi:MAG TPA: HD domain-containing protein [Candidatus Fusicatenibacter intestinigallinarum]|uniref:HD domain-containing protein n=1 Tax=Candidatus Fusicatenibacter intestinigallinarum TaxID=2838598 RepID=A0A9D2NAQ3_9FIRM|nr:HD domain-containing protein [Candidatus Fusicatenibacter intestinigallinarum]